MRIRLFLVVLGLICPAIFGQAVDDPIRATAKHMLEDALRSENAFKLLSELVHVAPHRLSGSPGAEAAIAWATNAFHDLGADAVQKEPVIVPRWVRGTHCDVRVVKSATSDLVPLKALALGGSTGTPKDGLEAEILAVQSLGQLRALGDAARGKVVFLNRRFDLTPLSTFGGYRVTVDQRTQGASEASKLGAVGVLIRSVGSRSDDAPHTGAMLAPENGREIPAAALSNLAADRLEAHLGRGPVVVRMTMDCHLAEPVLSANVVAELKGESKAEEVVVFGAHLDAWDVGQGAHDDGAGCAHVLEAFRLLKAHGRPRPRTLRAVLFINEENGLAGGKTYAETHRAELGFHHLAVESDSGGFAPRGFGFSGGASMEAALKPTIDLFRALDLGDFRPGGGGADISFLAEGGVPLFDLKTAPERYFDVHHSELDVLAAVHPRELSLGAATLAIFLHSTSIIDSPLPRGVVGTK